MDNHSENIWFKYVFKNNTTTKRNEIIIENSNTYLNENMVTLKKKFSRYNDTKKII